jgi:serine protease Do
MKPQRRVILSIVGASLLLTQVQAVALNAQEVYEKNSSSIFTLYGIKPNHQQPYVLGSAVAVADNILVTNCHVALAENHLLVKTVGEINLARLIYQNSKNNLCFIEVTGVKLNPVDIRNSKKVRIGEEVFAMGNSTESNQATSKKITANQTNSAGKRFLQTDTALSADINGGGLFDQQGKLIGITTNSSNTNNTGFAIPAEYAAEFAAVTTAEK